MLAVPVYGCRVGQLGRPTSGRSLRIVNRFLGYVALKKRLLAPI